MNKGKASINKRQPKYELKKSKIITDSDSEEEVKERKKLEKEKKKKEMLDKGILFKEDIKDKKTENNINTEIVNSENILNTEDKKEQEQENKNNDEYDRQSFSSKINRINKKKRKE